MGKNLKLKIIEKTLELRLSQSLYLWKYSKNLKEKQTSQADKRKAQHICLCNQTTK